MSNYSLWADLLNKFHTSSEWIQVLWLLTLPLLVFGPGWCVKETAIAFAKRKQLPHGELIYSVYQNNKREFLVYSHQEASLLSHSINYFKNHGVGESYKQPDL